MSRNRQGSGDSDHRAVLKEALRALEDVQARQQAAEAALREPLAVVGIGCRFPGGSADPAAYWRLLHDGVDAVTEVPRERWDIEKFYDADPDAPGKTTSRWGGFLEQVDLFDASFFGISPREATSMDPQQRLFLEVCWEALENAGQSPDELSGSQTGVFAGITTIEYLQLHTRTVARQKIDAYLAAGNTLNPIVGRVAYLLGTHGPSVALDTACSSSLTALHLACTSLRSGESDLILAGGVNVILAPETSICFSKWGMMAPDGRCKTFDARADGFVRGEGCGVVVLRRLADAQRRGDRILALIRGSAINQDGPSSGLTVPNGPAQQAVIRRALANAGVQPKEISYVEAHGTGTSLGDPIEVEALAAVLGEGRPEAQPLAIGSVKTNLGHLESASGIAGLIKVVLALQHREIPPHLHLSQPTPHLDWERLPVTVPTRRTPWVGVDGKRLAGVSSFGFSGANAHVILEEAPRHEPEAAGHDRPRHVLALSARTPTALPEMARRYAHWLSENPDAPLPDVCYTANSGRARFPNRAAWPADSTAALREQLDAFVADTDREARPAHRAPRIAFLFTGQQSSCAGAGRELYETQPTFRKALARCSEILQPIQGLGLESVLYADDGSARLLNEAGWAQPALFALQYSLAELWRSWGIEPVAVLGHGVGEYAAACVAGVFDLPRALPLVAERGRLMAGTPRGSMAAIFADEATVAAAIAHQSGEVSIAAINGARNTVIAGSEADVRKLLATLSKNGTRTELLEGSDAFHSPLVDGALDALEQAASRATPGAPRLPLISNLSGEPVTGNEIVEAHYWRRHAREPVRFAAGMHALREQGCDLFLELGPAATLIGMGRQCVAGGDAAWLPSLSDGRGDWRQLLDSVAALWTHGADVDWSGFDRDHPRQRIALPTYPFERQRYWIEPSAMVMEQAGQLGPGSPDHPWLDRRLDSPALAGTVYETELNVETLPFLGDHRVLNRLVVPATAYVELAFAGTAAAGYEACHVDDLFIREPLVLPEEGSRTLQLVLGEEENTEIPFQVFSRPSGSDEAWKLHADGSLSRDDVAAGVEDADGIDAARQRCTEELPIEEFYDGFALRGVDFGPSFRNVRRLHRRDGEALGCIEIPNELQGECAQYRFHPALLDACWQVLVAAWPGQADESSADSYMPLSIERFTCRRRPVGPLHSHAIVRAGEGTSREARVGDLRIFDESGACVAEVQGLLAKRVERDFAPQSAAIDDALYEIEWQAAPRTSFAGRPSEIAASLPTEVLHGDSPQLSAYGRLLPELDELAVHYVLGALHELGFAPSPGRRFRFEELSSLVDPAPRHSRLLARMLEMLAEDGQLVESVDGWEVVGSREPVDLAARLDDLMARYPECSAELTLLGRCGPRLAASLQGRCDPLELLFPDGSTELLERLYTASPLTAALNEIFRASVAATVQALPAGRTLRVLEVGAGTGGTTAHVLPELPPSTEYRFTDVSPLFLARAEQRFSDHPGIRFQTLDIEQDPSAQGLGDGGFDLVLASNVLHATADLRRTLGHVRKLLAPGGMLMVLEGTAPERWIDLTFGLTEGWWKFDDTELRPSYALLPRSDWVSLFRETGFDETALLPSGDVGRALSGQMLALTRAAGSPRSTATAEPRESWIVLADRAGTGETLADRIEQGRGRAIRVSTGAVFERVADDRFAIDPADPRQVERLLDEVCAAGRPACSHVVHLWSLDDPPPGVLDAEMISESHTRGCHSLLHLVRALVSRQDMTSPSLSLVTRGARSVGGGPVALTQAPIWGMGQVVGLEYPDLRCRRIDLDPAGDVHEVTALFQEIDGAGRERQVAFRGGQRHVARLVRQPAPPEVAASEQAVRLEPSPPGALDNLELRPLTRRAPGPGEVEIRVRTTGLNFRDVLNALGMYPGPVQPLGGECGGTIEAVGEGACDFNPGDQVIAVAPGGFGTFVTVPAEFVARRPPRLSIEEATTIPCAFMTAHHTLHDLAGISHGDRVLIHAAAGGVGLAAVQLAQRAGAQIFATAGSPRKREFLRTLGVRHVMDSRSLSFVDDVRQRTDGQGVDVVLNSLSGEFIPAGIDLLRPAGRFVEIGKRDIWDADRVAARRPDVSYFVVDLADLAQRDPAATGALLSRVMSGFDRGALEPLPLRVFPLEKSVEAFRHMAQAKHIGKLVIAHPEASSTPGPVEPLAFRADASYLITGGLAGIGLLTAEWMVERGARHVVLAGRSAPTAQASETLAALKRSGAEIVVTQSDVSSKEQATALLDRIREELPPLAGIFHSAGVLADGMLVQQNWRNFETVFAPKVDGAWWLHSLTRDLDLDMFVLYSSVTALIGNRGQANHAAANSFLDALAHHRRALGLAATSVNWGVWAEIGSAAQRDVGRKIGQGIDTISPSEGLRALEQALERRSTQVAVLPIRWSHYLRQFSPGEEPTLFAELSREQPLGEIDTVAPKSEGSPFVDRLRATPAARREDLLVGFVREHAAHVLGLDPSRPIDPEQPLHDLGLDSLLAVELRNRLGSSAGLPSRLPATLLFDYPTVAAVADYLMEQLPQSDERAVADESVPAVMEATMHEIEGLSDAEAEALLIEELANNRDEVSQ